MQSSSTEKIIASPAPLRKARNLLVVVAAATGLVVLTMGAHLLRSTPCGQDPAEQWMKNLALSAPALRPAGSPMRHPETVHPGVDLRFAIGMEIIP